MTADMEKLAREIVKDATFHALGGDIDVLARVTAALSRARNEAIAECAKVADECHPGAPHRIWSFAQSAIAEAIRALKEPAL